MIENDFGVNCFRVFLSNFLCLPKTEFLYGIDVFRADVSSLFLLIWFYKRSKKVIKLGEINNGTCEFTYPVSFGKKKEGYAGEISATLGVRIPPPPHHYGKNTGDILQA
jgi:hypothetical protein